MSVASFNLRPLYFSGKYVRLKKEYFTKRTCDFINPLGVYHAVITVDTLHGISEKGFLKVSKFDLLHQAGRRPFCFHLRRALVNFKNYYFLTNYFRDLNSGLADYQIMGICLLVKWLLFRCSIPQ